MGRFSNNAATVSAAIIISIFLGSGTFHAMAQSADSRATTVLVGNNAGFGSGYDAGSFSVYSRRDSTATRVVASSAGSSIDRLRLALADLKVQRIEIAAKFRPETLPVQRIQEKIERLEELLFQEAPERSGIERQADGERFRAVLDDLRLQQIYLSARYRSDSEPMVAIQRRIETLAKMMRDEGLDPGPGAVGGEGDLERLQVVLTDLKLKQANMEMKYKPQSGPMLDIDAQIRKMERQVASARSVRGLEGKGGSGEDLLARLNDMLFDLKVQEVDLALRYKVTSEPRVELRRRIEGVERLIEEELSDRSPAYGGRGFSVAEASHGL